MKSKYIIFLLGGLEIPIVFSPLIQHSQISIGGGIAIAAGFCRLNYYELNKSKVWGESDSLKLKSRPEDANILNDFLVGEVL